MHGSDPWYEGRFKIEKQLHPQRRTRKERDPAFGGRSTRRLCMQSKAALPPRRLAAGSALLLYIVGRGMDALRADRG
jgi:hypothetical protein